MVPTIYSLVFRRSKSSCAAKNWQQIPSEEFPIFAVKSPIVPIKGITNVLDITTRTGTILEVEEEIGTIMEDEEVVPQDFRTTTSTNKVTKIPARIIPLVNTPGPNVSITRTDRIIVVKEEIMDEEIPPDIVLKKETEAEEYFKTSRDKRIITTSKKTIYLKSFSIMQPVQTPGIKATE